MFSNPCAPLTACDAGGWLRSPEPGSTPAASDRTHAPGSCTCSFWSDRPAFPPGVFATVACGFSDCKTGFGGRFGVQSEGQDACAVGFDHKEAPAEHESQEGTVAHQSSCPHLPSSHFQHTLRGSAFRVTHCHLQGHLAFRTQLDVGAMLTRTSFPHLFFPS